MAPLTREAGSLPFPDKPVGDVDEQMPFDHLVVVMMENHSFDNLLGGLPLTHPQADGLDFEDGVATNSNPGAGSMPTEVTAFPLNTTAQGPDVSQSWKDTHEQIDGGAMDGFVRSMGSNQPMGYYPLRFSRSRTRLRARLRSPIVGSARSPGRPTRTVASYSPEPPTAAPSRTPTRCSSLRRRTARSSTCFLAQILQQAVSRVVL